MPSCKRCGECCKYVSVMLDRPPTPGEKNWMVYHKIRHIIQYHEDGVTEMHMMLIPCKCELLALNSQTGQHSCMMFPGEAEPDRRPENCRMNPQVRWQHPPECQFFNDEEEEK